MLWNLLQNLLQNMFACRSRKYIHHHPFYQHEFIYLFHYLLFFSFMRSFRNPYHIDTLKHVKSHGAAFLYMHWNHLCSEVLLRFVCEILNFHQMATEIKRASPIWTECKKILLLVIYLCYIRIFLHCILSFDSKTRTNRQFLIETTSVLRLQNGLKFHDNYVQ